jgi:GDP-mannose 6-dehydrogenase
MLGLSFKPDTDDLRESPLVEMAERLIGKGYDLKIYDHNVGLSHLTGRNRQYIEEHIPHLTSLLTNDLAELVEHAHTLVIGNNDESYRQALMLVNDRQVIVDLVGIDQGAVNGARYFGICW